MQKHSCKNPTLYTKFLMYYDRLHRLFRLLYSINCTNYFVNIYFILYILNKKIVFSKIICIIFKINKIIILAYKKTEPPQGSCFSVSLIFYFDNLFLVVASAGFANSMRHHQLTALAALYKIHRAHLPVCSSLISSSLGRFILRTNRHRFHLL